MKRRKVLSIISFLLITVILVTGCSKKEASFSSNTASDSYTSLDTTTTEVTADMSQDQDTAISDFTTDTDTLSVTEEKESVDLDNSSAMTSSNLQTETQEKIIQKFYLDVETKDFDTLITEIDSKISSLGGYVESSQISGNSFYSTFEARSANIIARVPSKKANEFVNKIDESSNIINNQKTTENVSLEYIDAQSRIKSLEIEQERLFAILEKADNLDNIITLESRLSDIRYELQNYESQLRTYDNQVEYSTITLNIQEVDRITPVTEVKQTFSSRIKNGFSDTMYHISEGFKNFSVWFIVNLPYFVLWGVIILIVVLIVRKYMRKSNNGRNVSSPTNNYDPNNQGPNNQGPKNQE